MTREVSQTQVLSFMSLLSPLFMVLLRFLIVFLLHSFTVSYFPFSNSTYIAFTIALPSSAASLLTLRRVSTAPYVYAPLLTRFSSQSRF
jgi:hypothetical protein